MLSYLFSGYKGEEMGAPMILLFLAIPLLLAWSTLYVTSLVRRLHYGGSVFVVRLLLSLGAVGCVVSVAWLIVPNLIHFLPVLFRVIGLIYLPVESSHSSDGVLLDVLLAFLFVVRGVLLASLFIQLSRKPLNWKTLDTRIRMARFEAHLQNIIWLGVTLLVVGGASLFLLPLLVMLVWSLAGSVKSRQLANERQGLVLLHATVVEGGGVAERIQQHAELSEHRVARALNRMVSRLERGDSVAMAAGNSGFFSTEVMLEVAAGEAAGTLPQTVEQIVRRIDQAKEQRGQFDQFLMQIMTLGTVLLSVLGFLMYFIIPKFNKIFDDFDMELPSSTQVLIQVGDFIVEYYYLTSPILLLMLYLISVYFFFPVFYRRLIWNFRQRIGVAWGTPLVLRGLRVAIAADRPAMEGLFAISDATVGSALGNRLQKVIARVRRGGDLWEELLRQRIIRPAEYQSLNLAQRLSNLPWVLETLADQHVLRRQNRREVWFEWIKPVVYIVLSIGVGWIGFALYLPLVTLVNNLC